MNPEHPEACQWEHLSSWLRLTYFLLTTEGEVAKAQGFRVCIKITGFRGPTPDSGLIQVAWLNHTQTMGDQSRSNEGQFRRFYFVAIRIKIINYGTALIKMATYLL